MSTGWLHHHQLKRERQKCSEGPWILRVPGEIQHPTNNQPTQCRIKICLNPPYIPQYMQQILHGSNSMKQVHIQSQTNATRASWTHQAHYNVVNVSIRHYDSLSSSIKTHPEYHAHCSSAMFPVNGAHDNDILEIQCSTKTQGRCFKMLPSRCHALEKTWNERVTDSSSQADLWIKLENIARCIVILHPFLPAFIRWGPCVPVFYKI